MNATDLQLLQTARAGSRAAASQLIQQHHALVYNLAWRMLMNPQDAEDATQEVLLKAFLALQSFRGDSRFSTWLYRIAVNHLLQLKRRPMEEAIGGFEAYGRELDQVPNADMSPEEQLSQKELVREAKMGCMAGMLLCLDRRQRMVYILGEIFEVDSSTGAALMEVSADHFRQLLHRARKDLYQFMNQKCGLVNQDNPCRCQRKTRGFINKGWVHPEKRTFSLPHRRRIAETLADRNAQLDALMEQQYQALFQEHPYEEDKQALQARILADPDVQQVFNLD